MGPTQSKSFAFASLHIEVVITAFQLKFSVFQMFKNALKGKRIKALNEKQIMLQLLWFLAETNRCFCRKDDSQTAFPHPSRLAWEKVTRRHRCCSTESGDLEGNCCQHQKLLPHCSQSPFQTPTQRPWEWRLLSPLLWGGYAWAEVSRGQFHPRLSDKRQCKYREFAVLPSQGSAEEKERPGDACWEDSQKEKISLSWTKLPQGKSFVFLTGMGWAEGMDPVELGWFLSTVRET